ncbi:MAG: hypothetical protein RL638_148, partial [Bacteroidota bacterium]
ATADGSGNYSVTLSSSQSNGATLQVNATDAAGNVSSLTTGTVVLDVTPPLIAGPSNSPGSLISVKSIVENSKGVFLFTANEPSLWSIRGGDDASLFTLSSEGKLVFVNSPDFENPQDVDNNNTYLVVVRATDAAGNFSEQTVTVTILNTVDYLIPIIDSDGDGVNDVVDLDDDNDGVLDSMEGCTTGFNFSSITSAGNNYFIGINSVTQTKSPTNNVTEFVGDNNGNVRIKVINRDLIYSDVYFDLNFTKPTIVKFNHGSRTDWGNFDFGDVWQLESNGVNYTVQDPNGDIVVSNNSNGILNFAALHASGTNDINEPWLITTSPVTSLRIKLIRGNLASNIRISTDCNLDTDNDDIKNSLDVDSDGDGCSDGQESGVPSNLLVNSIALGPYGQNGLSDVLETSLDNGLINYISNYSGQAIVFDSAPVIGVQPLGSTVNLGNQILLSVLAIPVYNRTLLYQWYKNGNLIQGANNSTHYINAASNLDSANYYCAITYANSCLFVNSNVVVVNVVQPPSGVFVNNLATGNTTPLITGTALANSLISLTLNGITYTTVTNSAGIWSVTTQNLPSGSYSVLATGTLPAQNYNSTGFGSLVITFDTDGDGVTDAQELLDGTDPNNGCSYNVGSQVFANTSTAWRNADCDGDGNPNGNDLAPRDFCVDGTGAIPANGTPEYDIFRMQDCDGDGILNGIECTTGVNCPDFDGDGIPNYLDPDSDNDQIADISEREFDTDGDGLGNYIDYDSDNDGILDYTESNIDSDGDRIPDYVDLDSDNDGILDGRESAADTDGDGIPNYLDLDVDGDGILDSFEALIKYRNQVDSNNDGRVDCMTDSNGNGLMDCVETSMGGISCEIPDTDGDGIPDFLDLDSDNDGILDRIELRGDMDGDVLPNYRDLDSDGDWIGDVVEGAQDQDVDGTPNYLDLDSDGDGIMDRFEGPTTCVNCIDRVDNNEDGWDDRNQYSTTGWTVDTDGDGIPDLLDLDSDGDGIPDSVEAGKDPNNPVDTDGDGVPDFRDLDSDNDGIPDKIEGTIDTDEDGIPNYLDLDSDNDGIPDAIEGVTDTDGDGIPNYLDTDSDNDGIPDAVEAGKDPKKPVDTDGDGKPDYLDLDSDNDGIPDAVESGKDPKKPVDTDKDGIPDYQDLDSDNDGIPDAVEAGKDPKNPIDTDKDGIPDYLDLDSDNDGISDAVEAGKDPINPVDTDKDGTPDYRDLDSDNDGIPDSVEGAKDTDGDGIDDFRDSDSDNDGISDADEAGRDPKRPVDSDGDGIPDYRDLDSDNDGIPDAVEGKRDTDGDSNPDYLDLDSDNDGYSDKHEAGANPANPADTDKDGLPDYRDLDSDADGITDALEDDLNYGALLDCDKDGIENRIDPDQCDTFTPQGISPNGDGQNDVLIIPGILRMGNNTLTIYNRWGNIVYQKDNYQNDWGGQTDRSFSLTSEDNLLPDGTYYYVIDFKGKYPEIGQYVYINRLEK